MNQCLNEYLRALSNNKPWRKGHFGFRINPVSPSKVQDKTKSSRQINSPPPITQATVRTLQQCRGQWSVNNKNDIKGPENIADEPKRNKCPILRLISPHSEVSQRLFLPQILNKIGRVRSGERWIQRSISSFLFDQTNWPLPYITTITNQRSSKIDFFFD